MSRGFKVFQIVLVLLFTLSLFTYNSNGKFILEGSAAFSSSSIILTNTTKQSYGQAFNNISLDIKNKSFNINFLFGIVSENKQQGSQGMAFILSPTLSLLGTSSNQYLGLFNETNNNNSMNHMIAIELDIQKDEEFGDIDGNHIGININNLTSLVSASAGYYDNNDGNFNKLSLISGEVMRLSIGYSQPNKQLNVTLSPADMSVPPLKPLLSLNQDLSSYFLEKMYLGFTASTGSVGILHYMLGVYLGLETEYVALDFITIPVLPPYPKKSYDRARMILVVCLTLAVIAALIASWSGSIFYLRHKKVKEVLEEWEIQYGPHRFAYKELFKATKGFKEKQLLGKGGFGQVYKGMLQGSNAEIAVKRTSHNSRQGMSEFLAEISTVGRLRHPNLVRLLGYCRHKEDLHLVYDFMPNGSLDKYLKRSNTNDNQKRLRKNGSISQSKSIIYFLVFLFEFEDASITSNLQSSKLLGNQNKTNFNSEH